jgi:hypothetical protein
LACLPPSERFLASSSPEDSASDTAYVALSFPKNALDISAYFPFFLCDTLPEYKSISSANKRFPRLISPPSVPFSLFRLGIIPQLAKFFPHFACEINIHFSHPPREHTLLSPEKTIILPFFFINYL